MTDPSDAPADAPADARPLRILLAEDNLINRNIARDVLIRWGYAVVTADNGREVLDALDAGAFEASFDLVLMDVQMPILDGIEATRVIRERERETHARRVPIVALTANATPEDRRRCLEAGMDDCIFKPIDFATLRRVIATIPMDVASSPPSSSPSSGDEFDWDAFVARTGDEATAGLLVAALLDEDLPRLLGALSEAIAAGDAAAVANAAHGLKGALGEFGVEPARHAAAVMEAIGRRGDLSDASRRHRELLAAVEELTRALGTR